MLEKHVAIFFEFNGFSRLAEDLKLKKDRQIERTNGGMSPL